MFSPEQCSAALPLLPIYALHDHDHHLLPAATSCVGITGASTDEATGHPLPANPPCPSRYGAARLKV